ncbi:uncharacterized protein LOC122808938 isoform X2 [Protopterus annectens]|nr:uncharacterized protein LOC122808938 isoform X2 [Protopterus annectens]XP_043936039.1 uncharacterized protein LOC122808938 isoform X2 [Protopterus annectens]
MIQNTTFHGSAVQNATFLGSNVTFECRRSSKSNDNYTTCLLCKNDNPVDNSSTPIDHKFQYVIQNATAEDEGFYSCVCYTAQKNQTKRSFRIPLILNDQVEAPNIYRTENENKIVCASKNSSYKYILCILYQNGHQVKNCVEKSNKTADRFYFKMNNVMTMDNFSCLCYTTEPSKWTHKSSTISTISMGGKYNNLQIIITAVCIIMLVLLLMVLGITGWICKSKQRRKKEEGITRAPVKDHTSLQTPRDNNLCETSAKGGSKTTKNEPETDNSTVTYAMLSFTQANKDLIKADVHDQSPIYSTVK